MDGVERPVLRADSLFRAVAVGPGRHEVELVYRPASFIIGAAVSAAALLAIAALALARGSPQTGQTSTVPSTSLK